MLDSRIRLGFRRSNLSIIASLSISMSLCTCIMASEFKRRCVIVLRSQVLILLKVEAVLSTVHVVIGKVPRICSIVHITGKISGSVRSSVSDTVLGSLSLSCFAQCLIQISTLARMATACGKSSSYAARKFCKSAFHAAMLVFLFSIMTAGMMLKHLTASICLKENRFVSSTSI